MAFDGSKYVPAIDALLSVADISEVSVKRVRNAIQEFFAVDLKTHKNEVNKLIKERLHKMVEEKESNAQQPKTVEIKKENSELALKVQSNEKTDVKVSKTKKTIKDNKVKKTRAKRKDRSTETLTVKPVLLSPLLGHFLGAAELPRTQVVKRMWDYIKEKQLQNPADKREILCDESMKPIFGEKMTMFTMNKLLSKHLYNKEDVVQ